MPSTARSRGLGLVLVLALATACADQPSPTAAVDTPFSGLAQTASVDVVVGPYTVTITDLGVPTGGTYSSAYAINNTRAGRRDVVQRGTGHWLPCCGPAAASSRSPTSTRPDC
jgi:hypothetical protein